MRKILLAGSLLIAYALLVAGTAYIDAFLLEPNWLAIEHVTISHPVLGQMLGGLTIVQLSDIHCRTASGFLEESVLAALRRLRPDVIFITGDFVSRRSALKEFWGFASRMKPSVWIYAVPGDDDEALINDTWNDARWREAGIALLVDTVVPVVWPRTGGRRLWLVAAGPGFTWGTVREKVPAGEPMIALAHKPGVAKQAALAGCDLVLAGDTHGGQMGVAALGRFSGYSRRSPYLAGLYRIKQTLLYVNSGMGWKARPMRFFRRPELTVFHFTPDVGMREPMVLPGDE